MQLSAIATALSAGTYSVVVADANGCTQVTTVIITEPSAVTAIGSTLTNVSCFNGNNGSATVNPGGGTSPYSYQWSPIGCNSITANNLSAGTYSITVTDANGCSVISSASVSQPSLLTAAASTVSNVSCNGGNNGSATVIPGGGTTPYTYQWSSGGYTAIENNLAAGTYTITVTDANGCSTTSTATITQPAVVTATISNFTNVSCHGGNNGTATVIASGGTGTYSYAWNTNPMQLRAIATALTAGTYSVVVADANGC